MFGAPHYAIASYNAGESRVARWRKDKPDLEQDEFIDDIPFPETQNYVKRILGTAEDYRRLYGDGLQPSPVFRPAAARYVPKVTSKPSTKKAAAKKTTKKPVTKKASTRTPAAGKSVARKSTATKVTPAKKAAAPKKKTTAK
jgi:soluble lytic murein transglycosylase